MLTQHQIDARDAARISRLPIIDAATLRAVRETPTREELDEHYADEARNDEADERREAREREWQAEEPEPFDYDFTGGGM